MKNEKIKILKEVLNKANLGEKFTSSDITKAIGVSSANYLHSLKKLLEKETDEDGVLWFRVEDLEKLKLKIAELKTKTENGSKKPKEKVKVKIKVEENYTKAGSNALELFSSLLNENKDLKDCIIQIKNVCEEYLNRGIKQ